MNLLVLILVCIKFNFILSLSREGCLPDWDNQCFIHSQCCSNFCWREDPGWAQGVCKSQPQINGDLNDNSPCLESSCLTKNQVTTNCVFNYGGLCQDKPKVQPDPPSNFVISRMEFRNAVTRSGYKVPTSNQYIIFSESIAQKAGIKSKREAAMFLTHILWESDGLQATREYACLLNACKGFYESPGCDVKDQYYYGRGYIQLSFCSNYRQYSYDLYGNDSLIYDPDIVARDEGLAWDSAFWFWMIHVHPKDGVQQGKFGVTTRAINGEQNCDGFKYDVAKYLFSQYRIVLDAFGLDWESADESGCYN